MVDVYNQKAATHGLASKMHALCLDIAATEELPAELQNVDVIVCSMSFHHIDNVDRISKILASLLKKGGHLLVLDLLQGQEREDVAECR